MDGPMTERLTLAAQGFPHPAVPAAITPPV